MIKHSELKRLSIDELRGLQAQIKYVIQDKLIESHEDIRVGSKVRINHRKCIGKEYIIEKINRKTYILRDSKDKFSPRVKASLGLIEAI
tara:strand:+ start:133 stop:399 length:267 start_codon:yes stop_codon:yes gene_type:complete